MISITFKFKTMYFCLRHGNSRRQELRHWSDNNTITKLNKGLLLSDTNLFKNNAVYLEPLYLSIITENDLN